MFALQNLLCPRCAAGLCPMIFWKFMIGRSAISLMLTSPTPFEGNQQERPYANACLPYTHTTTIDVPLLTPFFFVYFRRCTCVQERPCTGKRAKRVAIQPPADLLLGIKPRRRGATPRRVPPNRGQLWFSVLRNCFPFSPYSFWLSCRHHSTLACAHHLEVQLQIPLSLLFCEGIPCLLAILHRYINVI